MSQKLPNGANNSEPLYHEHFSRRHSARRTKAARDGSIRGVGSEKTRDPGSKGDSLRKESYADQMPAMEFSIKTRPKQQLLGRSESGTKVNLSPTREQHSETWGRILRAQASNENVSGFSKFDPLRTIHFLGKELQSQLKHIPHDSTVYDVISEMQQALKRIPQDIQIIADAAAKKQEGRLPKSLQSHKQEKSVKTKSESCQTPNMWYLEPVRLQQHLEESSEKIERACQQMEVLCSKLKTEKENLSVQLEIEKEASKLIQQQVDEYRIKLQRGNAAMESLKAQNVELKAEVEQLKVKLSATDTPSAVKLKLFIQSLQEGNAATLAENERLKQQVQLAQNETEKYEAILQARDLQVKEIRYEMTQLQEVVNEQMQHFQNLSTSEDAIDSNIDVHYSPQVEDAGSGSCGMLKIQFESQNDSMTPSTNSQPVQELFNNRHNQYDDTHSASGSARFSADEALGEIRDLLIDAGSPKLRHVYKVPVAGVAESSSLRDKFLEAKCHANRVSPTHARLANEH